MIKPIMRDIFFLNQKSELATEADKQVAIDLLDTLKANEAGCVGMAANMIGVKKRIIAVNMGSVSYTHLDVYKRQVIRYTKRFVYVMTDESRSRCEALKPTVLSLMALHANASLCTLKTAYSKNQ